MRYDPTLGYYLYDDKPIYNTEIEKIIALETNRLATQLEAITRSLVKSRIDLPTWELNMATALKESHIRMAILASGGYENTPSLSYLIAGTRLKEEYGFLDGFTKDIADGNKSDAQAIARSKLYAQSTAQTFSEVYHAVKTEKEGFDLAMRSPDLNANHCPDCPNYSTNGEWRPAYTVVPKGKRCRCRGRCRCQVLFRRRGVTIGRMSQSRADGLGSVIS